MAFIVIVHLSPEHKSNMAELLQTHTSLEVMQVNEKTEINEDCVYIIPPDKALTVGDSHLTLSEPEEDKHLPRVIDQFFRSLGSVKGENAACIILSGTGSDGTTGMKTVKENGGLTIAQEPEEAQYGGMPQSAIDVGIVDKVLPVEQMFKALKGYRKSLSAVHISDDPDGLSDGEEDALSNIFGQVKARMGHDFSHYKRKTMLRRIERRMHVHNAGSLDDYRSVLEDDKKEAGELFKDLLISVTNFFRDPKAFEALKDKAIPKLFESKDPDDELRVWVPGCATGEEAYSIAMLLQEYAQNISHSPQVQVFATDIDEEALEVARQGRYPESVVGDVPARLQHFFKKDGSEYVMAEGLRRIILFSNHDLLKNPPFSKQDMISCRNLLIYLNKELQKEVFNLFHYALQPNGLLFLGSSDSNLAADDQFQPLVKEHRIFQARKNVQAKSHLPDLPLQFDKDQFSVSDSRNAPSGTKSGFEQIHQRIMSRYYAPPSVIINEGEDTLHASGDVSRYLSYKRGEPSRNILEMVISELRQPLRSMLYRTKKEDQELPVHTQVRVHTGHERELVELNVDRLREKDLPDDLLLVVFRKISDIPSEDGSRRKEDREEHGSDEDGQMIDELENELRQTKEQLQITAEDYETSNEELRSSNEELQSMNEELQSTAEELETSQEELRSVNEELKTVNQELESKIEELQQSNNDLKNLMEATEIAIIFVDRKLRLKRFTSKATDLFNLTPSDIGRPLAHYTHRLDYDSIIPDIEETLDTLEKSRKEVSTEDGDDCYIMRLGPYQTTGSENEGVVITFMDVTDLRAAQQELSEKIERIKDLQREILETNVNERWRLGKQLHDEVAQSMVASEITLQGIQRKLEKSGVEVDVTEDIDRLLTIIKQNVNNVRDLSHEILPVDMEARGASYAFDNLAKRIEKTYGLSCTFEGVDVVDDIDDLQTATNLYRVAQEAAKNAALHGQAENVKITLTRDDGYLQLTIKDDGKGLAAAEDETEEDEAGMGINIMRHRMELMDGTLEVNGASHSDGTGVTITAKMPFDGEG
jgi:two-component system CheB/CheR fusion protein